MKRIIVLTVVALIALMAVSSAAADSKLGWRHHLKYQGAGSHAWVNHSDSPNDNNNKALEIGVGDPAAGEYIAAFSYRSLRLNVDVEAVKNLGFEFSESGHVGAGAPRISVQFQNGDVGYLSATYCNHPMAITGGEWGRADFTRYKTNCTIFVSGETGGQYDADGARSVWQVYADANPSQVLDQAYFVADESGEYAIDRLALGSGVMYHRTNRTGKVCTTEASC